jgi:hypothetical protein
MTLPDQLYEVRSRMDSVRQSRRFASAVGRRSEAQHFDSELDNLHCEEAELMERIAEQNAIESENNPLVNVWISNPCIVFNNHLKTCQAPCLTKQL